MVKADTARLVLMAVAQAVPEVGDDVVTRLDIGDGWGGSVYVRVHSTLPRGQDDDLAARLRSAVGAALSIRHRVEVVRRSPF